MSEKFVIIHGDKWKYDDVRESIEIALKQKWTLRKWKPRAALVSKGSLSDFHGQQYDSRYTQLVENAWDHDHCDICWWSLHESDDPVHGEGYTTDGHAWICTECFRKFINV